VDEYSGGMVRRLEIAQSTLHRPRVLFLDEPTVGLDPIARDAVWKRLFDLRADYGTTLFFTTHYLEEAESHCERIAIMHLGKVAAIGTCEELESSLGGGGQATQPYKNQRLAISPLASPVHRRRIGGVS
jgi:ABC-2 type transport system ATP-binding protein